ncbi:hypothetical protein GobsT_50980 [Gemmata obscuriglobus]|uniref:ISKra4 family transposase n=1 Tax=Gemmata obscuriglobus TaxID=114 RepID=A0A2Z3H088_9BACT|nr:hypothetical protein [Gemmata obscuriglobus]AWM37006.1 hypothetical protein C1280_08225 [Gemmata obscuriglobus]QEG30294.1 hypothetical protein GobsT_50980 [Gemmata obscuriglobus]VTS09618.1 Uncharacterized protein OS=Singulisphaera acidiphila (strain ATCC BAA-1392 / DSM 18658 / VKM B-2454 / MOB10) GN=Sinac_2036 PE=4 SV=1 [Gemmata obscuriglobus UQM 2246]
MTAVGTIELRRTYFVCPGCRDSGCPLDDRIGLTDSVSPEALQLIVLAGGSWSFDAARTNLTRFCGVEVSDELIRPRTLREGPKLAAFGASAPEAAVPFRTASGDIEFETDATKVNTVSGWRDAKIGIFVKRVPGPGATVAEWDTRTLPAPTARFAFAEVAESDAFASQWVPRAEHLGIDPQSRLSVLADGAEWIWNRTAEAFPNARGVLDIFHALEYVSHAARGYLVNAPEAVDEATARGRELLLGDGYTGVVDWVGELGLHPRGGDGASLGGMLNYLAGHQDRLTYALRLRRGQTIGSGLIEGAAKNLIGRRLKANNARWVPENVNRIAGVCCALYSGTWDAYWESN